MKERKAATKHLRPEQVSVQMCTTSVQQHPQHLPLRSTTGASLPSFTDFSRLSGDKRALKSNAGYIRHSSCATRAFSRSFWHTYPRCSRDAQVFHDLLKRRRLLRLLLVVQGDFLAEFSRIVWGRHLPFFSKTQSVAWDALRAAAAKASSREELWALESTWLIKTHSPAEWNVFMCQVLREDTCYLCCKNIIFVIVHQWKKMRRTYCVFLFRPHCNRRIADG